ncbi:MAG: glycosyltransferase family 4 protein [Bacteroidetes bacterium]|nr:glycosyltransferase family 4 protein [Bacteroidota bacterium]
MHLGFVSYEFPPDTGFGGIATYVQQMSAAMAGLNIEVDVFVGSPSRFGVEHLQPNYRIHYIRCLSREAFIRLSPVAVRSIHLIRPFDGLEYPEYGGEARFIREQLPNVPLWIKLHTPSYLVKQLNDRYYDRLLWRRVKKAFFPYKKENDPEYLSLQMADRVFAPCHSLRAIAIRDWQIKSDRIQIVPYPYRVASAFTNMELPDGSPTAIFVGRLETRKGVWNLAKAIPLVLQEIPNARFIFLGKDSQGPLRQRSMKKVLLRTLGPSVTAVEFIDAVPLQEVPTVLSRASVAVFPSLWENFPNVCLEAMAAGRAIVASRGGGMVDMLTPNSGGVFVDPEDPRSIADGLLELFRDPARIREMGIRNRERAVQYYGKELIQELLYLLSDAALPRPPKL